MAHKKMTTIEAAEAAAMAHTDMNIFEGIVSLLEGGLVSSGCQPDDFKIIEMARRAQRRCLKRYDAAIALLATKPI